MYLKLYNFIITSFLGLTFLFSNTITYAMVVNPSEERSSLQLHIINKTNKDISIVVEANPNFIISNVTAGQMSQVGYNITFGPDSSKPAISLFEIPPKLLFIYIIRYQEGRNDKCILVLTSQIIENIIDAIKNYDQRILSIAEKILASSLRADRVYEATLTIEGEDLKKSTIEMQEEGELNERLKILEIIKKIAPSLYKKIEATDRTGKKHLIKSDEFTPFNIVTETADDGLPRMWFGSYPPQIPENELQFAIAHELSHYVLGHNKERTFLRFPHKVLQKFETEEFKKGKKIIGQLPFKQTFENAYFRNQELEADRSAIMEFGIPIDDAVAWFNRYLALFKEHERKPEEKTKETFQRSHPFFSDRLNQIKDLKREVEIRRKPTMEINWEKLADEYLKLYWQK
jgi:hypothetical protein